VIGSVIWLVTALLPASITLPSQVQDWIPFFHAGMSMIGFILPVADIFAAFSFFLLMQGILLSIHVTMWVWGLFHGNH